MLVPASGLEVAQQGWGGDDLLFQITGDGLGCSGAGHQQANLGGVRGTAVTVTVTAVPPKAKRERGQRSSAHV